MHYNFRRSLALSFMALVAGLTGCGGTAAPPEAASRLPGKWHGEMIVYEEAVQGKLPPDMIAELAGTRYDFEFRPDGSMALTGVKQGQAYTTQGHWQLVKQQGELLTIKSTEQSGTTKDINIEFDGNDTFYIPLHIPVETEVAEAGAMRFTRLR